MDLSQCSDEELIQELEKRKPNFAFLPKDPTNLMCLRGQQGNKVFYDHPYDLVCDYIRYEDLPHVQGVYEGSDPFDSTDDREFFVIAAIYRGCVSGYTEGLRSEVNCISSKDQWNKHVQYWNQTIAKPPFVLLDDEGNIVEN